MEQEEEEEEAPAAGVAAAAATATAASTNNNWAAPRRLGVDSYEQGRREGVACLCLF